MFHVVSWLFDCFSDGNGACTTESFGARADWSHGNAWNGFQSEAKRIGSDCFTLEESWSEFRPKTLQVLEEFSNRPSPTFITASFDHLSVCIRLQKDLLQKENELKAAKKELMISHRRLEEESDKVTDSQLKASKLNSELTEMLFAKLWEIWECFVCVSDEMERLKSMMSQAQEESTRLMSERWQNLAYHFVVVSSPCLCPLLPFPVSHNGRHAEVACAKPVLIKNKTSFKLEFSTTFQLLFTEKLSIGKSCKFFCWCKYFIFVPVSISMKLISFLSDCSLFTSFF